jgi:alpha-beta hydrolase superfamily lysophospholipase
VTEVWQTSRPSLVPALVMDWALWVAEKTRGFDREQVCPVRVVEQIAPRPLLVIHGTEDRRITEQQVQELFAAAEEPKSLWLVDGANHNGIRFPVLDVLSKDVISFLNRAWQKPQQLAAAMPVFH